MAAQQVDPAAQAEPADPEVVVAKALPVVPKVKVVRVAVVQVDREAEAAVCAEVRQTFPR